ncbi:Lactoylglutathione lyase [hydrothermal vent metagenome]|uniref:Lactoylglutathione lyase n=1 Tax=hydrothermal vent metagenome TaxID=652676 RepID=A0A3B0XSY4_9ZZZZ
MRFLHTMLRVGNLGASINFYTEIPGMKLLRKKDYPEGKFTLAIEVDDVYKAVDNIRQLGEKIIREAGPMNAGSTIIAFIEDPDGYPIKLLAAEPHSTTVS